VAACPAGVISGAHFSNDQIFAQIKGALWDAIGGDGNGSKATSEQPAAV